MKKILSILIGLLLSVSSTFAAHTITINAYAVNKDGSTPVGGTVTLKVTKSRGTNNGDSEGTTKTTDENGNTISVTAKGYDGIFLGIGSFAPEVDLSAVATGDGFFVEGIYLDKGNGVLEGAGNIGVHIEGIQNETRTYKVVFDKKNSNLPDEITFANHSSLNFYTGTESDQITSAFYKEKTKIDLSNTFAADGQPLFDVLYLFGITTGKDGAVINEPKLSTPNVPCNASTPCYVYKKPKDGNKYIFDSEVDAVQTRFDHSTSMNSKKLYFTGYCPFANIGSQATDEGWMYFTGGRNAKVDIYLENCEILGKYRSGDGSANFSKFATNYVNFEALTLTQELKGVSSIFVFEGTHSTAYVPSIHIKGTNHLKGQFGYITEVLAFGNPLDELMESLGRLRNVETYSAPITLKTKEGKVNLIMDDLWPEGSTNRITNGFLKLDAYLIKQSNNEAEKCPCIDLGTENGSLTINGGQYHLRNNASLDGQYTSNLAICYRKFSKAEIANLYGFGNDMTEAPVVINSGTFTMYPNLFGTVGAQYYLDDAFMDLRLPNGKGKSQINGGTFNGIANVVFCSTVSSSGASPVNAEGEWLCLQDVPVNAETTSYGSATFDIPVPFAIYEEPMVVYDLDGNIEGVSTASQYGGQSANAYNKDGQRVVSLLLSGGGAGCESGGCPNCEKIEEALYQNWAFAIPKVRIEGASVPTPDIGGEITIATQTEGEISIDVKVNQLLFMDMQGLEDLSVSSQISGTKLSVRDKSQPRGQINNPGEYTIHKHLNLLKVVDADTWYCFTAPFDIDHVSVLEVWENHVSGQPTKQKAIEEQFVKNSEFWIGIHGFLLPNGNRYGTGLTFEQLANSSSLKSQLVPLTHYDGNNLMTANYYLYKLNNEEFTTDGTREELDIEWTPVSPLAGEPLMRQGQVYAIQFPWCPMCNDLDTRDYYDYWSKKFIRFYGKGAQIIQGSDYQSTILATTPAAGSATLVGNSTLADMTLAANTGYVHNTTNDYFDLNTTSYTLKPTEGFMLYNPGASPMPARISRSGMIEYGENNTSDLEGVPTIGDRTSIMLFDAMDGFEVLSLCEQLVTVYNLQGNVVFQQYMTAGEQMYVGTGAGIFVVRGESEAIKVMIE